MHFRDAQAARQDEDAPTNIIPLNRHPMAAERVHIENVIAQKRREIARLAQEIRWLTLELES